MNETITGIISFTVVVGIFAALQYRALPAQKQRGFPLTSRYITSALVAAAAAGVGMMFLAPPGGVAGLIGANTAIAVYLLILVMRTDLRVWKIPKEPCFAAIVLGVIVAPVAVFGFGAETSPWSFALALFPALYLMSLRFTPVVIRPGMGDIRLGLAGAVLVSWWAPLPAIAIALVVVAGVLYTLSRTRAQEIDGVKKFPAGPGWASYAVAIAAVSALFVTIAPHLPTITIATGGTT